MFSHGPVQVIVGQMENDLKTLPFSIWLQQETLVVTFNVLWPSEVCLFLGTHTCTRAHTQLSHEEFFRLVEQPSAFSCWPLARITEERRAYVSTLTCLPVDCQQCQLKRGPARKPHTHTHTKHRPQYWSSHCTVQNLDFIKWCKIYCSFFAQTWPNKIQSNHHIMAQYHVIFDNKTSLNITITWLCLAKVMCLGNIYGNLESLMIERWVYILQLPKYDSVFS